MSFSEVVAEDQRLLLLQALEEDPDYSHNEHVLRSLLAAMGHHTSRDSVRTQLAWLAEQGLVELMDAAGTQIAKLTARGEDVALGNARAPGVARPRLA